MAPRREDRLGKFRLDAFAGRGAFAEVWYATDMVTERPVALKVVPEHVVKEWGKKTVEREARLAVTLKHPNLVETYEAQWAQGQFLIAMEPLSEQIRNLNRRSIPRILYAMRDVARGLAYLHGRNLIHRDLKPENVLLAEDGTARLADFGGACVVPRARGHRSYLGTLGYAAPEQVYGRPSLCSDVFAWGLVTYERLTGDLPTWPLRWPFAKHDDLVRRVPEPVVRVIAKAVQLNPERRYQDGLELVIALNRAYDRAGLATPLQAVSTEEDDARISRVGSRRLVQRVG